MQGAKARLRGSSWSFAVAQNTPRSAQGLDSDRHQPTNQPAPSIAEPRQNLPVGRLSLSLLIPKKHHHHFSTLVFAYACSLAFSLLAARCDASTRSRTFDDHPRRLQPSLEALQDCSPDSKLDRAAPASAVTTMGLSVIQEQHDGMLSRDVGFGLAWGTMRLIRGLQSFYRRSKTLLEAMYVIPGAFLGSKEDEYIDLGLNSGNA